MNNEQAELLNIIQQVLRGVVTAAGALNPDRTAELSATLAAFASNSDIDPTARAMLQDLAQGPGMLASAQKPKH